MTEDAMKRIDELLARIDKLLAVNTAEVERRRIAESKIEAIYKALGASELASWQSPVLNGPAVLAGPRELQRTPCGCSACIVIRGIRAFIENKQ